LALEISSAYTRPNKRIWAQIALNVGRDDFSCNAIASDKPLICARHDDGDVCKKVTKER